MTNKQVTTEIIFCVAAFLLSWVIVASFVPQSSFYVSDIYIGGRPVEYSFMQRFASPLTFGPAIFIFFSVLFVINSTRTLINKFELRAQNIFLLFVAFVSLMTTLIFTIIFRQFAKLLFGGWTIYPPLSALPDEGSEPGWTNTGLLILYGFIIVHFGMIVCLCMKIFRKTGNI